MLMGSMQECSLHVLHTVNMSQPQVFENKLNLTLIRILTATCIVSTVITVRVLHQLVWKCMVQTACELMCSASVKAVQAIMYKLLYRVG